MPSVKSSFDMQNMKSWIYSILIACLGTFLLYNPESVAITKFWFITFFAIALFAFEPIPNVITGVMMCLALIIFGVATPDVVFTGWTTFLPWYCFAGLFMARMIEKTGFAQRIALYIIKTVARTPLLLYLSFLLVGYALNLVIADGLTNTIVVSTFALSICYTLRLNPFSKAATCLMLASYFSGMSIGSNYLPNGLGIVGISMLKETGFTVTWLEFFVDNISLVFLINLVSFLILYLYSRKEIAECIEQTKEVIASEFDKLGKISFEEVKSILLMIVAVTSLITEPYHGMPGVFLMAFVMLCAFVPPVSILDKEDMLKVNTGLIFFIPGCLAIGFTAGSLGLPQWIAQQVVPILEQIPSEAGASVFAYVSGFLANFVLTPLAASAALTQPMADLAVQMGFNVKALIYPFFMGLDQWLFPYELAPVIYIYALGYLKVQHFLKLMFIRFIVCGLIVWFNSAFIWSVTGL